MPCDLVLNDVVATTGSIGTCCRTITTTTSIGTCCRIITIFSAPFGCGRWWWGSGSMAVHCKQIEVVSIDYRTIGVYSTCDSWFCLGMDEFKGTHGACSRGSGTGRAASWAVKFQAELRDEDGQKVEALFEGHYCTKVVY